MRKLVDRTVKDRVEVVESIVRCYEKLSVPSWTPSRADLDGLCTRLRKILANEHALVEEILELDDQNTRLQQALAKSEQKVKELFDALHDPDRDSPWT